MGSDRAPKSNREEFDKIPDLPAAGGMTVFAKVFTSRESLTMGVWFIEATELKVVVKLIKSGKVHRLQIATLSNADVDYVAIKRAAMNDSAKRKVEEGARLTGMERGARRVVDFVMKNKGAENWRWRMLDFGR